MLRAPPVTEWELRDGCQGWKWASDTYTHFQPTVRHMLGSKDLDQTKPSIGDESWKELKGSRIQFIHSVMSIGTALKKKPRNERVQRRNLPAKKRMLVFCLWRTWTRAAKGLGHINHSSQ